VPRRPNIGRREIRVGEGADRDGDQARHPVDDIEERGTANGAELKGSAAAAVADAGPFLMLAGHFDLVLGLEGLGSERTPRALLALEAMTDRHADRVARAGGPQLPAPA